MLNYAGVKLSADTKRDQLSCNLKPGLAFVSNASTLLIGLKMLLSSFNIQLFQIEKFEDFLQKTCDTTRAKQTTEFVAVSWHFLTNKQGSCTAARQRDITLYGWMNPMVFIWLKHLLFLCDNANMSSMYTFFYPAGQIFGVFSRFFSHVPKIADC